MDRRHPVPRGGQDSSSSSGNDPSTHRRVRSYSQPLASPGPSNQRPPEAFDFLNSHPQAGPSNAPSSFPPLGFDFDDDAILRSILAEGNQAGPSTQLHPQPSLPPTLEHMAPPALPSMHQLSSQQQMATNPLLSQTFVAWLQYMQLQAQLQQQQGQAVRPSSTPQEPQPTNLSQPQRHPHHQQPLQQSHSPFVSPQVPFPILTQGVPAAFAQAHPHSPQTQAGSSALPTNTPSPDAGDGDLDNQAITEEKRRRNTAASARFRVKKKQWTLNLERSITDLSGRVEELEREASELRRENGWLKEIVMLKSKRFGSTAPNADLSQSDDREAPSTSQNPDAPEEENRETDSDDETQSPGKGKEVQR